MELEKNQDVELSISGVTHDGNGVGRTENRVVFVPGCACGDIIKAKIVAVKKSYAYGKLTEIVKPSAARIPVDCRVFSQCGGCVFRHIAYQEELRLKAERVKETLHKIAGIEIEPEAIEASPHLSGYRNKAQYPAAKVNGELKIGFYAPHSHRIVDCSDCKLQPPVFEKALAVFRDWAEQSKVSVYDEKTGKGLLRHIFLRCAPSSGEFMACAVVNGDTLPDAQKLTENLRKAVPQTASVIVNVNRQKTNVVLGSRCITIWGKDRITDRLGGRYFEISPLSFYQVNSAQAEQLYKKAAEYADFKGGELLLDLYCGAGTIGLFMADRVGKVIGVDIVPEAIEDAKRNAALNAVTNAEFFCADAKTASKRLCSEGLRPDVVVVDPPRKGLDGDTVLSIVEMSPRKVVYVSCDPATLARDITLFGKSGYLCARAKPFDMFPRTAHVETVCLLERK